MKKAESALLTQIWAESIVLAKFLHRHRVPRFASTSYSFEWHRKILKNIITFCSLIGGRDLICFAKRVRTTVLPTIILTKSSYKSLKSGLLTNSTTTVILIAVFPRLRSFMIVVLTSAHASPIPLAYRGPWAVFLEKFPMLLINKHRAFARMGPAFGQCRIEV